MNRKRMELMKTLLLELKQSMPANQLFNLHSWAFGLRGSDTGREVLSDEVMTKSNGQPIPEDFCGTCACAVGSAALDPRFNEEGLWLACRAPGYTTHDTSPVYLSEGDVDDEGWDAVMNFFDLSYDHAEWLFMPSRYDTVYATSIDQVLERVQLALDGKLPPTVEYTLEAQP